MRRKVEKILKRYECYKGQCSRGQCARRTVKPSWMRPWQSLPMGINLHGFFLAETGLGESVRLMHRALSSQNMPVAACNRPLPGGRSKATEFSEMIADDAPYNVAINIDGLLGYGELARQVCRRKYNISLPFWELDKIDQKHTKRLRNYDKILAPSRFVERVLLSHGLDQVEAIRHPFFLPGHDPSFEIPRDRLDFLFYFDFDSFPARKNPEAAVLAFQKAFEAEKDVRLTIKVRGQNDSGRRDWLARQVSSDSRINVIDRFMTRSELDELMHDHDVFVSLHRSEGLGLGLAEAMAAGKIVVATDYGGSTDFVNLQTGYPVQFNKISVGNDEYVMAEGASWADPSIEHAAEVLRAIYTDPEEAKTRAERGFRHLSEFHSFSAAGKKIATILQKQGVLQG